MLLDHKQKKMKVLHLTFDMRIGGTEMVIKNIIEGLSCSEFTMSIFCIESPLGPWGESLKKDGIEIYSACRKEGFDPAIITKIRKHVRRQNIDIIHCHQYTPWVYGTLAAAFTKTKVIFTEHGRFYPDSTNWKRRLVNPLLTFFTDNITSISRATKSALVEFEYIPPQRIDVIYNGISEVRVEAKQASLIRKSLAIPNDAFVLGTIARFDPIKNHLMMLEAFAAARKENPRLYLIMIGDGTERHNIECKIEELKLNDFVTLTGYQPNPSNYLSMFDVFLLSSLSEGTSMTLLESLSLGIPCVVTDAGGNAEIIENNKNGFVTPNNNTKEFSQAILRLATEDLTNMKKFARKRFDERFTNTMMNEQYHTIYELLVGENVEKTH